MNARIEGITKLPLTLDEVAHTQVDVLFDIDAILQATIALEEGTAGRQGGPVDRLMRVAQEKLQAVIDEFSGHISLER